MEQFENIKSSIIIITHNDENDIIKCLNSIPVREDIEIIIVDNCSTDTTLVKIRSYIKQPVFIKNLNKHMSDDYCKNIGMKYAHGEVQFKEVGDE